MLTEDIAAQWFDTFDVRGKDRWLEVGVPHECLRRGAAVAYRFIEQGTGYDDFQPRNGYAYITVLHDLLTVQAAALVDRQGLDPAAARERAREMGPAARAGGDLLFAVPSWHVSTVLNLGGFHTPDYIESKFKIGVEHAVPLAIYITAFDEEVTRLRENPVDAGAGTGAS